MLLKLLINQSFCIKWNSLKCISTDKNVRYTVFQVKYNIRNNVLFEKFTNRYHINIDCYLHFLI